MKKNVFTFSLPLKCERVLNIKLLRESLRKTNEIRITLHRNL